MFKSLSVLTLTCAVVVGMACMTQKVEALSVADVSQPFAVDVTYPTSGPSTVVGKLPLVTVNTIQSIVRSPTVMPTTTTINPTKTTQTISTTKTQNTVRVPQTGNPIVIFVRPSQPAPGATVKTKAVAPRK